MNKLKVIHIFHELKFSGAEIMYVDAAKLFQEKNVELTALATGPNLGEYAPYFKDAGYSVLHIAAPCLKHYIARIGFYIKLVRLLKQGGYDVVHIHSSRLRWGGALCAWIAGLRSVYTFHNVFPTKKITYLYHLFLRWSAKCIFKCKFQTISDSVYDHEKNFYHNNTTKIYNWYNCNRFFPVLVNEKDKVRQELGIAKDALVLVSVGGCSPVKQHSEIIKAMPLILLHNPNCMYLHLGQGVSEYEEVNLAVELGVDKNIQFYGNQPDVRKFLIASDIYIMPSKFEGIPITTIEAMGCGIPSILYDVPGLRDFNKNGNNSLLITEDYKVLAEKVVFLDSSPQVSIDIATSAKSFVDKNFNMKTNALKVLELYTSK
ncbi:glycosyltransferase family 4 protein [Parabacteroides sp. FAFU027]|uniref:glycosyltransferase family 4 protein n=1 Tax=Parabacteroides sp. FAFU027 TaxID=2922715 RepID=UPI001FAF164A|nr:glycosyltransferase family 4 protein [Parabacteroides sp. FAFU027]